MVKKRLPVLSFKSGKEELFEVLGRTSVRHQPLHGSPTHGDLFKGMCFYAFRRSVGSDMWLRLCAQTFRRKTSIGEELDSTDIIWIHFDQNKVKCIPEADFEEEEVDAEEGEADAINAIHQDEESEDEESLRESIQRERRDLQASQRLAAHTGRISDVKATRQENKLKEKQMAKKDKSKTVKDNFEEWKVIHHQVSVRALPAEDARIIANESRGQVLQGKCVVDDFDVEWLKIKYEQSPTGFAFILINGKILGMPRRYFVEKVATHCLPDEID